jgi:serine phosphatase RsbU (regulator of sigma subunit)
MWLLPVWAPDGRPVDYVIGAAGGQGLDLYGGGATRIDEPLSKLYPSMVDGPLWRLYQQVLDSGVPANLADFRHRDNRAGVVADAVFDVSVHPVLGGLLVWWQRLDEDRRRLERTELLGSLGWADYELASGRSEWSPGMYRLFARDPSLGPLSLAEQSAAILPADHGIGETAWQTLDSGGASDVTVRIRAGGSVKHLRILSEVTRDADGTPVKIYAVVQDVTARENSRTAIDQLNERLRTREMTALAEHRLAGQLQNIIQPITHEPLSLAGLEAVVSYLPAESALRVGGDWYHAQTLPSGQVVLAIGDVAGHGLAAASGMAHLRYGLVAWLSIGLADPGTLLGHLNRLSGQLGITGTALIAVYDPGERILRWARAGHLPPLLARGGQAADLDPPPGLLLGADSAAVYPPAATELRAGDLLLLYTDGLVERRTVHSGRRLDEVTQALSRASADPGDRSPAALRRLLLTASPDDDTCTLTVRVL